MLIKNPNTVNNNKILNIRKDENTDKNNRIDKLELEISKLDKKIDKIVKEKSDYTLERKNLQQNTAIINFDDTEKNLLLENIKNNQKKIMQLNKESKINIDKITIYRDDREKDLEKKSAIIFQNKYYLLIAFVFGFLLPIYIGYLFGRRIGVLLWVPF